MSYQSLSKPILDFLKHFAYPKILEIGIDKGQTMIPLCHNLTLLGRPFCYDAIDIKVQDYLQSVIINMGRISCGGYDGHPQSKNVNFYEESSLDILPKLVALGIKYNLILLDGDHNYYTVSRELKDLEKLCYPSTMIICDDYDTKWAYEDLYYSEYKEYKNINIATAARETQKKGVRAAVEEFVQNSNNVWSIGHGPPMDYCILFKPKNIKGWRLDDSEFATEQRMEFIFNKTTCTEIMNLKGEENG